METKLRNSLEKKLDEYNVLLCQAAETTERIRRLKAMLQFAEEELQRREKALDDFIQENNLQEYVI